MTQKRASAQRRIGASVWPVIGAQWEAMEESDFRSVAAMLVHLAAQRLALGEAKQIFAYELKVALP